MFSPGFDPFQPPEGALPPAEVRITDLRVEPWPDGRRVRVLASLTPFQQRPTLAATITDEQGEEVASTFIIENMQEHIAFTMHIRTAGAGTAFTLTLAVQYPEIEEVDSRTLEFTLNE